MASSPALPARFVALDIRKQAVMIGAVDAGQHVVLTPRRVAHGALECWMRQHLRPNDAVVIDSPTNAWELHDQVAPLVASVIIAHPRVACVLTAARSAASAGDTINLARMHAAGLVPGLWVPPPATRDLRAITAHRRRLIIQRAEARDLLHAMLRRYRLTPPGADRLAADRPDWWATRGLAPDDLARVRASLASLDRAVALLAEADTRLEQYSSQKPWIAQVACLMQVPGMSALNAIILLAEIGEIGRFPSASQLVGYAGLGNRGQAPGRASDGEPGQATAAVRDGRQAIRSAMLEIAQVAIREDVDWQAQFEALDRRIGRNRAIVAIARKLLLCVWEKLAVQANAMATEPLRCAA
jgi:transposase